MTEEPRRHNRFLIVGIALILIFTTISFGYVSAFQSLQVGTPSLSVRQDGFTFTVVLSVPVRNPSVLPIPTFNVVVSCVLNGHTLFAATSKTVGNLNAGSSCVIELSTTINVLVAVDLATTLGQYILGQTITYSLKASFSVYLGINIPIYNYQNTGSFKI